jgi:excinuclease UvrABC nuclease subunit
MKGVKRMANRRIRVNYYKKRLLESTRHAPSRLNANNVPKKWGLYAWFTKRGDQLVYIGKATGKKGLWQRIVNQHLNPNYLETIISKHTSKDQFQLENPTLKNGKVGIDKSAFRKNVARHKRLKAGKESVSYLKRAFNVSFIVTNMLSGDEIRELEKKLIIEYNPKYNFSS